MPVPATIPYHGYRPTRAGRRALMQAMQSLQTANDRIAVQSDVYERDIKGSVKASTTAPLPACAYDNGVGNDGLGATLTKTVPFAVLPAQDGVALVAGDRLLVQFQVAGLQDGIYEVTDVGGAAEAWILTRTQDADQDLEVTNGSFVQVQAGGAALGGQWFCLQALDPVNIGTTDLVYAPVPPSGSATLLQLAANTPGDGASLIGIEDVALYFAGGDVEAAFAELVAQIGGLTSTTFGFAENNVLADNDALYAALEKLDLWAGDIMSTVATEGASLVGIEDAATYFTLAHVEGALAELVAQIGGATSTTFNFAEANILVDNDSVYAALEKLDIWAGNIQDTTGAGLVGILDAALYFTLTDVEGALAELVAQIGGLTSSTFGFAQNNVLADNDSVYAALEKLDLFAGGLPLRRQTIAADATKTEDGIGPAAELVTGSISLASADINVARRSIRFKVYGVHTAGPDNTQIRVRVGGVAGIVIADTTGLAFAAGEEFWIEGTIVIRTIGAGGTFVATTKIREEAGPSTIEATTGAPQAIDTTGAVTLVCTVLHSGFDVTDVTTIGHFEAEILPA